MIGKTVMYKDKIYQITQWIHYRLEWFEVELKDNNGYHKFWLKEGDLVVINRSKTKSNKKEPTAPYSEWYKKLKGI